MYHKVYSDIICCFSRFIVRYSSVVIRLNLPEEIRGSEIRKRRSSAATAKGESGLLVRKDYRRGRRKSRRALGAVTRVVSLTDRGTGGRLIVTIRLTGIES